MKLFALFIFVLTVAYGDAGDTKIFRYKSGNFNIEGKEYNKVDGSIYWGPRVIFELLILAMDMSTMTPFLIGAIRTDAQSSTLEETYPCGIAKWLDYDFMDMTGTLTITGTLDRFQLLGECYTPSGKVWKVNTTNVRSNTYYFPPVEAGLRAKYLLGQSASYTKLKTWSLML